MVFIILYIIKKGYCSDNDSEYNREVAKDSVLYYDFEIGSLKEKLEQVEKFRSKEFNEYGEKAKSIIRNDYTWEIVVNKHIKLFNKLLKNKE